MGSFTRLAHKIYDSPSSTVTTPTSTSKTSSCVCPRISHATLVERHSRFTLLCRVKNKGALAVIEALAGQMYKLPRELSKSLTWDRGAELSAHKAFSLATDMAVYFCDPSSPWQRGTNENTNGLLRQYFPKGTCLSGFSQTELNRIAEKLNTRPRKTLQFKTPAQVLQTVLQ